METCGKADCDGQQQCDGAGVADECPDSRGDGHKQDEEPQFAFPRQFKHFVADHFGQPGLEDCTADHKQPDHHNYDRIRKSGQGLFGCKNLEYEQQDQRTKRDQV